MRLLLSILTAVALVACLAAAPAIADWDPDDPVDQQKVKMHFAQLPDLDATGMDVNFTCLYLPYPEYGMVLADDWTCTKSGWVKDIHFWFSAMNDWFDPGGDLNAQIVNIHLSIHQNIPEDPPSELFSKPGDELWETDFDPDDPHVQFTLYDVSTEAQGWYNPSTGEYLPGDHFNVYQCNIVNIPDPFFQSKDTVYWLDVTIQTIENVAPSDSLLGWKTADFYSYPPPYTGEAYMDDAVWGYCGYIPNPTWLPMVYPSTHPYVGQSLDLAFVITGPGAIPTLSEWGLIILFLLLVGAGLVLVLRRRRAAA